MKQKQNKVKTEKSKVQTRNNMKNPEPKAGKTRRKDGTGRFRNTRGKAD